ncbi:hypothetical protein DM02DRAFT_636290 [Periconia macrospinosa]|uniref:Uncharacterized protein n=1 Tax=Periconia macrospinosa TaxID=97972 RepID=A0A2V1CZL0_9PLEO|nr:hypothetical protein DM02DRAFT_636290 [Periconia macrospinosa]
MSGKRSFRFRSFVGLRSKLPLSNMRPMAWTKTFLRILLSPFLLGSLWFMEKLLLGNGVATSAAWRIGQDSWYFGSPNRGVHCQQTACRAAHGRQNYNARHTHELCHGLAKQWVELNHGRATIHEPAPEEENALKRQFTQESLTEEEAKEREEEQAAAIPEKFIEDEHRATGDVKVQVYWRYIKAATLLSWTMAILVVAAFRVLDIGLGWFIKAWGEGYDYNDSRGIFKFLPPTTQDVVLWVITFFLFVTGTSILYWDTYLVTFRVGFIAAKTIFKDGIVRVAHATFRYYATIRSTGNVAHNHLDALLLLTSRSIESP